MNITELWTLRIEHDYYRQKESQEINVKLSQEIEIFLMRHNLMWRRKRTNEWNLITLDEYELNKEYVLELEVVGTGIELPYITDLQWPVGNECYEIEMPIESKTLSVKDCATRKIRTQTPNCILKLQVPIGRMFQQRREPITTKLTFEAVRKYWEYIFIPRQQGTTQMIRLEDTKKTISFGEYEIIDFMGHKAYRIRSLDKVPLQEHYQQIDIVLWEKLLILDTVKERILFRTNLFPNPSLKLEIAKDTVWRICYI